MTGRKYDLTVIVCAILCALLAYKAQAGGKYDTLLMSILALIGAYHGANVVQDKLLGGKK